MTKEGPTWKNRRRFMIAVILFCMATISVVILKDMQSSVAETAVTMSFAIMGSTIASYVFGVVWQDNTITQSGKLDDGLADR